MTAETIVIFADYVPVVFHAACRVTHRVGILTHVYRSVMQSVKSHIFNVIDSWVHAADYIDPLGICRTRPVLSDNGRKRCRLLRSFLRTLNLAGISYLGLAFFRFVKRMFRLSLCSFIVYRTRRVKILDPSGHGGMIGPTT